MDANGDQIILGLNANENTRASCLPELGADLGLLDVHDQMWGEATFVPTCNKSMVSSHPIDAVWCSLGLDIVACGLFGFGSLDLGVNTDHRLLWLDVQDESLFGIAAPRPAKKEIQNFPLDDPPPHKPYCHLVFSASCVASMTYRDSWPFFHFSRPQMRSGITIWQHWICDCAKRLV